MYKHLSREERYQIHRLLKAKQTISEIARSLGRSRSTISREIGCGRGQLGYRAEQACAKASERAQRSRNARRVDSKVWSDVDAAREGGCKQLAVLHSLSGYPAPAEDYNLYTIPDMIERFGLVTGLSDHTLDNTTAITSAAMGASIIKITLRCITMRLIRRQLFARAGRFCCPVPRYKESLAVFGQS